MLPDRSKLGERKEEAAAKKKKKKRESRDGTRRPIHFGCPPRGSDRLRGVLRVRHSFIRGARIREDHSRIRPVVQLPRDAIFSGKRMEKIFHLVRLHELVPAGRPVGSTIYPGMQVTAVTLWKAINRIHADFVERYVRFFPGVVWRRGNGVDGDVDARMFRERLGRRSRGVDYGGHPAHTMRSIAGGYDNESLAVTAMVLTFYMWARSNRNEKSWPLGAVAGLCYVYMVAAWGGYTFVLNMVGLHAAALVALRHYTDALRKAYSLFWIVGTLGAIQFPVVGLQPIKSAEQIAPMFVFFGLNIIGYGEMLMKKQKLQGDRKKAWQLRIRVYTGAATIACAICAALAPTGWFGPLSVRVRGLFIKHTQTGNPLVDSVAEHQPGTADAYERYLHKFHVYDCTYWFPLCHGALLRARQPAIIVLTVVRVRGILFRQQNGSFDHLLRPDCGEFVRDRGWIRGRRFAQDLQKIRRSILGR